MPRAVVEGFGAAGFHGRAFVDWAFFEHHFYSKFGVEDPAAIIIARHVDVIFVQHHSRLLDESGVEPKETNQLISWR